MCAQVALDNLSSEAWGGDRGLQERPGENTRIQMHKCARTLNKAALWNYVWAIVQWTGGGKGEKYRKGICDLWFNSKNKEGNPAQKLKQKDKRLHRIASGRMNKVVNSVKCNDASYYKAVKLWIAGMCAVH